MSTREDVERGILVYTCNCGWFDTGHADSRSRRPNVGAESMWRQIITESGLASQKVGSNKNHTFSPVLHPCDECKGPSRFPSTFQQIAPAAKGSLFRDWTVGAETAGAAFSGSEDEAVVVPLLVL